MMRALCYIQKKYYKWKIDLIADDLFKGEKKNCEIEVVYPENFSLNTIHFLIQKFLIILLNRLRFLRRKKLRKRLQRYSLE